MGSLTAAKHDQNCVEMEMLRWLEATAGRQGGNALGTGHRTYGLKYRREGRAIGGGDRLACYRLAHYRGHWRVVESWVTCRLA